MKVPAAVCPRPDLREKAAAREIVHPLFLCCVASSALAQVRRTVDQEGTLSEGIPVSCQR